MAKTEVEVKKQRPTYSYIFSINTLVNPINSLGVMVSFVNGQVIKEKVPRLNSGPLFDYLLKVSNGNPAVDIEKGKIRDSDSI